MSKMVKKGDVVVCLRGGDGFTEGCTYTVEKVFSKKEQLFELINDNGNQVSRFLWKDEFKKA